LDAHLCSERCKNDRFWIIMEYCDMGSLLDLIHNACEKDGCVRGRRVHRHCECFSWRTPAAHA
jgi:hypothetical protein